MTRWRERWGAMSARRRVAVSLLALFALGVAYVGVTFVQVWFASYRNDVDHPQAIIVLGAAQYDGRPSPALKERLDHAYELWQARVAPIIVTTGGKQMGDRFTEASAGADYLIAKGVPDASILREVNGAHTYDSLAAAARFLKERGITRVVLVSDPFHNLRIGAIADEVGLQATESPSQHSPIVGWGLAKSMMRETAAVSLGRITGFRRLVRWLG